MALKRIDNKTSLTKTERSMATLDMSSSGLSDTLDFGGLALTGIEASTGLNACLYAFNGSMNLAEELVPVHNSIGGRITLGSTYESMGGKMIVIDPPMFAATRFLQIHTITSTGGTVAQTTSDSIRLCVTDRS